MVIVIEKDHILGYETILNMFTENLLRLPDQGELENQLIFLSQVIFFIFSIIAIFLYTKFIYHRLKLQSQVQKDGIDLFMKVEDLCCIANLDGYFCKLNPAWEKTLGYTQAELIKRPFLEFVHPEDRPTTLEAMAKLKQGINITCFENRYLHKDGREIILQWTSYVNLDEGLIYGIARNTTQIRETELAYQKTQELLQTTVTSLPMILYATDKEGIFTIHQGKSLKSLNIEQNQLVGSSIFTIYQDYPEALAKIEEVLTGENCTWIQNYQNTIFQHQLTSVKNSTGEITGLVGVAYDITEREKLYQQLATKEEFLTKVINNIADAILVVNNQGQILYSNQKTLSLFGRSFSEIQKHTLGLPLVNHKSTDIDIIHRDGKIITAEMRVEKMQWQGESANLISLRDVSDRHAAEVRIQESEKRLNSILNSIDNIIWSVEPETFCVLFINQAVTKITGYSPEKFYRDPQFWFEIVHPEDLEIFKNYLNLLNTKTEVNFEYRIICADNQICWLDCHVWAIYDEKDYKIIRIDGMEKDITSRKQAEIELQHLTFYDPLTHLPNRTLFLSYLEYACKNAQEKKDYHFAVLVINLDEFKIINEAFGHSVGDTLLQKIANELKLCLQPSYLISRLGGDEFAVLLEGIQSLKQILSIIKKIHSCLNKPISIEKNFHLNITVGMGIIFSDMTNLSPKDLLSGAEIALHRAKKISKNNYVIFNPEMQAMAFKRINRELDLRKGLENNSFELFYQPIVSLENRQILGFEALVRLRHPTEGVLSPGEFITIAEETGLIIPLGFWVFHQACYQLQQWHEQFPEYVDLQMSINLSPKQFHNPRLIEEIDQIFATTKARPDCIKLEITESLLMRDTEATISILQQLQKRQLKICVDDFGTGYSSLSYLHRFPINILKIDRCFVKDAEASQESMQIIRIIVNLASSLGLDVIAEGVETDDQVKSLCQLGCQKGQGFLFAKPLSVEEATNYLKNLKNPRSA